MQVDDVNPRPTHVCVHYQCGACDSSFTMSHPWFIVGNDWVCENCRLALSPAALQSGYFMRRAARPLRLGLE